MLPDVTATPLPISFSSLPPLIFPVLHPPRAVPPTLEMTHLYKYKKITRPPTNPLGSTCKSIR